MSWTTKKFIVTAEFEIEAKNNLEAMHKWDMRHFKKVVDVREVV